MAESPASVPILASALVASLQAEIDELKRQVDKAEDLREMMILVHGARDGASFLVLDAEMRVLKHACHVLCAKPTTKQVLIRTGDAGATLKDEEGVDIQIGPFTASRKVKALDGDRRAPQDHHARVVRIAPPAIYLTFAMHRDSHFQRSDVSLRFVPELNDDDICVDVSCIVTGAPQPQDGVILSASRGARFGNEEDAADDWPADGEYFWSWSRLAVKFVKRAVKSLKEA